MRYNFLIKGAQWNFVAVRKPGVSLVYVSGLHLQTKVSYRCSLFAEQREEPRLSTQQSA